MDLEERIESFSGLGEILRNALNWHEDRYSAGFNMLADTLWQENGWFTPDNVRFAIRNIAEMLTFINLKEWCSAYPALTLPVKPVNVGVIMAGNIPLAGFHDFLAVLMTGNNIIAKTSVKDRRLPRFMADLLCLVNSDFKKHITFSDHVLTGFDAVIATGSDNSSRYFEYYFGKYPNIIRKNRNSIAILEGDENSKEIEALGMDVFSYFGLGCRNVSKVYLPENYPPEKLTGNWGSFSSVMNNNKYSNNYAFNKAVYLVNGEKFSDAGFLLLKEEPGFISPVSVLHYEYYTAQEEIRNIKEIMKDKIQCITGRKYVPFGKAQTPKLWDYADGIDTIEFLLKKNVAGIL
jgi:hypothetical protein